MKLKCPVCDSDLVLYIDNVHINAYLDIDKTINDVSQLKFDFFSNISQSNETFDENKQIKVEKTN